MTRYELSIADAATLVMQQKLYEQCAFLVPMRETAFRIDRRARECPHCARGKMPAIRQYLASAFARLVYDAAHQPGANMAPLRNVVFELLGKPADEYVLRIKQGKTESVVTF